MCKSFGYKVTRLEHIRTINIKISDIDIGKWRNLTEKEIKELKNS